MGGDMRKIKTKIVWSTEGGEIETYHVDFPDPSSKRDLNYHLHTYEKMIREQRMIARRQSRFGEPSPMFVAFYVDEGDGQLGEPLEVWKQVPVPYAFMKLLVRIVG